MDIIKYLTKIFLSLARQAGMWYSVSLLEQKVR